MQAVPFKRRPRVGIIALLVLVAGAALAFALLSSSAGPAQAKVRHHAKHHARHHSAARAADPVGATDGDNVQSGDQTTPDTGAGAAPGESTGSGESSVETETGQPGEPVNGHQDTGSGGGNECTGTCVQ